MSPNGASIQIDHGPIRHFKNGGPIHDQFVCWWRACPSFTKSFYYADKGGQVLDMRYNAIGLIGDVIELSSDVIELGNIVGEA